MSLADLSVTCKHLRRLNMGGFLFVCGVFVCFVFEVSTGLLYCHSGFFPSGVKRTREMGLLLLVAGGQQISIARS